jgi:hypothetical protein
MTFSNMGILTSLGRCVVFVLATFLVGSQLLIVAESVPVFDVKKSCQGVEVVFAGRNSDNCIQSEEATRGQLKESWGDFSAKDKVECVGATKIGGVPTYTELITCLEMRRDVQKLRSLPSDETKDDRGAAGSRRK